MTVSKKAFLERWKSADGEALAEEVVARLMAGRSLEGLGLEESDGLIDLRGLPAPVPRRLHRFEADGWFVEQLGDVVKFQGVQLSDLDLSGAQLESFRFHDSQITGCRFDSANCRDWRLWHTDITDCSFTKTDLRGAAVGTWHEGRRNSWRRVDFSGADLRVGVSQSALYEDCDFSAAKLIKVNFEQCGLVRCRFSGRMSEVVFDGRELSGRHSLPMDGVDFSNAIFDQVEFMGFDLGGVEIPKDPDVRLIRRYRCVVEHALAALDGEQSLPARMLRGEFQNRLRMMRAAEEDNIFNRRDYAISGGDELVALVVDLFTRAEAECDSSACS